MRSSCGSRVEVGDNEVRVKILDVINVSGGSSSIDIFANILIKFSAGVFWKTEP